MGVKGYVYILSWLQNEDNMIMMQVFNQFIKLKGE